MTLVERDIQAEGGPQIAVPYWIQRWLAPYADSVRAQGARVRDIDIQSGIAPKDALDGAQGLMLIGGGDVEPERFGLSDPNRVCRSVEPTRDAFEIAILTEALARDLPVLAICRGVQVLSVTCGGALHLDIPTDLPHALPHRRDREILDVHRVAISEGSLLESIIGARSAVVNSRHHQAVRADRPGSGLVVSAVAEDGVVEALESPRHGFVLGVQWHPENFLGCGDRFAPLFRALVERAAARSPR
jgi:putative glutamine amidotransferase